MGSAVSPLNVETSAALVSPPLSVSGDHESLPNRLVSLITTGTEDPRPRRMTFPAPHELDADPNAAREKILLPRIPDEIIKLATAVATVLNEEVQSGKSQRFDTLCQAAARPRGVDLETLEAAIKKAVGKEWAALVGPELTGVVVALCMAPAGFLRTEPAGFLELGDATSLIRFQTLLRYFIVHQADNKTARDIERGGVVPETEIFPASLRSTLLRPFSSLQLLAVAIEGIIDGFDPPVRPWLRSDGTKWQGRRGELLTQWGAAWLVEFQARAYDRETGSIKRDALLKINPSRVASEAGVAGAVAGEYCKNFTDLIAIGVRQLTGKELIGQAKDQIRPWQLTSIGMWQRMDRDGTMLIDKVTDYLLSHHLPAKYPKLVKDGRIPPRALAEVPSLLQEYMAISPEGLRRSGLDTLEALKRRIPNAIGPAPDQLHPWELRRIGMWQAVGHDGRKLIDDVTDRLRQHVFPAKYPALYLNGQLQVRQLLRIPSLAAEFAAVHPECLRSSGLSPIEALARVLPDGIGLRADQIQPWEVSRQEMWSDRSLFRKAFAFYLAQAGVGSLDPVNGRYELDAPTFEAWVTAKGRGYSVGEIRETLRTRIKTGFDVSTGMNMEEAFRQLFEIEDLPRVGNNPKTKVALGVLSHLNGLKQPFRAVVEFPSSADLLRVASQDEQHQSAQGELVVQLEETPVPETTYALLWNRLAKMPRRTNDQRKLLSRALTTQITEIRGDLLRKLFDDPEFLRATCELILSGGVSSSESSRPFRLRQGYSEVGSSIQTRIERIARGEKLAIRDLTPLKDGLTKLIRSEDHQEAWIGAYLRDHPDSPVAEDARELIEQLRMVKGELLDNNLPLIMWQINRHSDHYAAADEAMPHILAAIDSFDLERGVEFSTHLVNYLGFRLRTAQDSYLGIRLSRENVQVVNAMRSAIQNREEITPASAAARWGVSETVAEALLSLASRKGEELDAPGHDGKTFRQVVTRGPAPERHTVVTEQREQLRRAVEIMRTTNPRHAQILELRYGLTDQGVLTQEQVGGQLNGITKQRVQQLEVEALDVLREVFLQEGFADAESEE